MILHLRAILGLGFSTWVSLCIILQKEGVNLYHICLNSAMLSMIIHLILGLVFFNCNDGGSLVDW